MVVRIFPLSNASAERARTVVEQLFREGDALRRVPGTQRQALPTTATGQALTGSIAAAVDERTNALIVAGAEEAVAFVEVLVKQLDSERAANWIEPAIIELKHADARTLAVKLQQVLVQGLGTTPEALGLQKQFGRLRLAREGAPAQGDQVRLEADLFAPLTGLVITPEEQLNALIVVGSPANIAVVRELATTLDVPKAAASNEVRVSRLSTRPRTVSRRSRRTFSASGRPRGRCVRRTR